jgi:hypothetical protein
MSKAITDCNQHPEPNSNLLRAVLRWKQKRQSSAEFLGVLDILGNVVGKCDIPTTIYAGSIGASATFRILGYQ